MSRQALGWMLILSAVISALLTHAAWPGSNIYGSVAMAATGLTLVIEHTPTRRRNARKELR